MGAVYLVEHINLKTRHAIKVLLPHLSRHPQIVQRFRNEARAAAATRSPNIVATRDFGQLEDGSWYLVMDYWEGTTLGAFLAARGPLSHDLIIRIALDVLSGLAAAHKHHIIHRDLSIYAVPFAQVWVDEEVESAGQTPLHLKLRVGSHRLRLVNKRLNKNKTVRVTITASQKAVIDETSW